MFAYILLRTIPICKKDFMITATPLANFKEFAKVRIKQIQSDSKTQVRLLGLGIGVGSNLEVLRNRGGDMVLANNNSRISLGRTIADKIMAAEI